MPKTYDNVKLDFFYCRKNTTIVDKTNVTLLQSPFPPSLMLINEWLRQREAEFSAKALTTTNLQHWTEGEGGNGNLKVDF